MNDKYAKLFETANYGQILATKSTLSSTSPNEHFVTLHFQQDTVLHRLKIQPRKADKRGLNELFDSIDYDTAVMYIRSHFKEPIVKQEYSDNCVAFNRVPRGSIQ